MKILNIMFSKGLGGIEQVFLDYTQALSLAHHNVIPVIHPASSVASKISKKYEAIKNFSKFDPFAVYKLRKLIENEQPHCIITHGNRATQLVKRVKSSVPIIAVCHNYKFKPLIGSDAVITITQHLKSEVAKHGQAPASIFHVPNFINIPKEATYKQTNYRNPVRIGFIGRLVHKKGADILLEAIENLEDRGIESKLVIAGEGEEQKKLEKLTKSLGLTSKVDFLGWVEDKKTFFESIDILCVPSRHEPFGVVLLEGFLHSKPIVVSKSEGPLEIIDDKVDGLLHALNDPDDLTNKLEFLIKNQDVANNISAAAFKKLSDYSVFAISRKLSMVLEKVVYNKLTHNLLNH